MASVIKPPLSSIKLPISCHAQIAMALEDRFNLNIPDEQFETVSTVGNLFEVLGSELAGKRK